MSQLYDPQAGTFLADRFVKGTCPVCKTPNQYGDNCEKCGSTYSPSDLIDPVSTISGAKPEVRTAKHLFIELEKLHAFLDGLDAIGRPPAVRGGELPQGALSWRAAARLGHIAAGAVLWLRDSRQPRQLLVRVVRCADRLHGLHFCSGVKSTGEKFDDWWQREQARPNETVEIHHFIGKDITYFHTLFWPGMLKTAGYNLPRKVHIHGFLTVDGEKMSKSRGTFVLARTYLKHLDPSYLRYYYASKLTPRVDDLDLNREEFVAKVNSDLVGKVVNLASRTARFVEGTGLSKKYPDDGGLFDAAAGTGDEIAAAYEACDYNRAMRQIMLLADRANQYVDSREPWKLKKEPGRAGELQDICTVTLNLFRQLAVYLAPVLPRLAEQTGELLNKPIRRWDESKQPLVGSRSPPLSRCSLALLWSKWKP